MAEYCPSCMAENPDDAEKCSSCGGDMHIQNRTHQLPVMTILNGRYLTGRVLGEGGFGITYIGYDFMLREKVAIKEYYPSGISTRYNEKSLTVEATSEAAETVMDQGRTKFLEEARTMVKFRNMPNVVSVIEFFYANGTAYIVMEYLDGQSMQGWLKEHGPEKDFDTLYVMLRPVMEGLAQVHREKLIHRDISPSNLMLLKDGTVKLLDFGTAREVNEDGEKSLSVVLKHGFAPEEQYRRRGEQGPWTDVYALCATIYKLLTGVTPEISIDRLAEDNLKPPSELGVKINAKQERVLLKGLAVKKEDRIKSVDELVEKLDAAGKLSAARKKEEKEKKKAERKIRQKPEKPKEPEKIEKPEQPEKSEKIEMPEKPKELHKQEEKKETGTPKKRDKYLAALAGAAVLCLFCVLFFRPGQKPKDTGTTPTPEEPYVQTDGEAKEEECEVPTDSSSAVPEEAPIVAISAGFSHTVGLREDGTVELARKSHDALDWKDIVAISAGGVDTAGLKSDGAVITTNATTYNTDDWTDIADISFGDRHLVGLKSDGTVVATGSDSYGQCDVSGWENITEISAGSQHTVGLKSDGTVVATGNDLDDRCGVSGWKNIVAITAGERHTVGLKSDGTVVATGKNSRVVSEWKDIVAIAAAGYYVVGLKSDGTVVIAADSNSGQCDVSDWTDIVAISAGGHHIVGLKSDGTVVATGRNEEGQCNVEDWYTPSGAGYEKTKPSAQSPVVAISAGLYHTVGLKEDGTVVIAGKNDDPSGVSGWDDIVAISAGITHTVGLKSDGTVMAAGYNSDGQRDVADWTNIIAISAGYGHTEGLKKDGTVVATGLNDNGQCDVSGWTDIVAISSGWHSTVGLKSDGTVVATGNNEHGQCNVSGWTDIVEISAGNDHTVGLKADGTVVATGYNGQGQCDVYGWTDIVEISAGNDHAVGLKSDGTVVATGYNKDGQCDVSGWTDIVAIFTGEDHTVGFKSNGTVVATGNNNYGQCDVTDW